MIIDFRQGIVDYDFTTFPYVASGGGTSIQLVVGSRPITLTIAQAANNYTFQENATVNVAWTVPNTQKSWLYWDFNTQNFARTFGFTLLQPLAQNTAPLSPQTGQMWYNTQTFHNYVFQGGGWTEVLRVLAAEYNPLTSPAFQFITMGDEPPLPSGAQNFTGTQIGVNQINVSSGFPLFNYNGVPIAQGDGTFLTTETVMFAQGAAITGVRLESNVYTAFSSDVTTIPAYAVVAVQPSGSIQLGAYNDAGNTAIAMAIQNISSGGSGAVCLEGTITNTLWNWSNFIGELLWISGNNPGQLVTTDPHLSSPITYPQKQPPVARVLSNDTIIFLQGIGTQGPPGPAGGGSTVVPATPTQQGIVLLSTDGGSFNPPANVVVADGDPRLTNARTALSSSILAATNITVAPDAPSGTNQPNVQLQLQALGLNKLSLTGGTMTGNLILNANPTVPFQAATKNYVDNGFLSIDTQVLLLSGGTMTGNLILNANPTQPLQAATKQYVDSIAEGITFQAAVTAASTADVGASYAGSPIYTLTANTNGVFTVDGVSPVVGNRVLIKNQTIGSQNGIYDVTNTGSISTPFVLTRDAEQLPPNTIVSGTFVFVNEGVTQNSTGWVLSTSNPITLDVTSQTYVQFSSAANVTYSSVITALGYVPVGPFPVTGSTGISVSGSPVSGASPSGPVLTLSAELVGLNNLSASGFGFVQRTGVGTYVSTALTGAQVSTALGYIPLASRNINTTAPLSGGGALTSDLTLSILPFTGSGLGAVPVSPGGTTQFLRADGTWSVPPGGGGGGGVSSVALSTNPGSALVITGTNPITTSGTITVNLQLAATGGVTGIGTITGGSGYVNATYHNVPLTGGSGAGVLATVIVTSTVVSGVTITTPGSNYYVGNTLSVNNSFLGGTGAGFSVPVSAVSANPGLTQDTTGLYVGLSQITNQMLSNSSVALSSQSGSGTLALGGTLTINGDTTKGLSTTITGGTTVTVTSAFAGTTSSNVGVSWFDPIYFTATSGEISFASGAGTSGQFLTSAGAGNTPTWSTLAATGPNGAVQYNNSGAFDGSAGLTYSDVPNNRTLTIGETTDGTAYIQSNPGGSTGYINLAIVGGTIDITSGTPTSTGPGSAINLFAGAGVGSGQGGNINLEGGAGGSSGPGGSIAIAGGASSTNDAGNVTIVGGASTSSFGGYVLLRTTPGTTLNYQDRLFISPFGEWQVNGVSGIAGQKITATGSGSAPIWSYGQANDVIFATSGQTVFNSTSVLTQAKTAFPNGTAYIQVFVNGLQQREDNSSGNGFSPNPSGQFYVSGTHQITFFVGLSTSDEVTLYQIF